MTMMMQERKCSPVIDQTPQGDRLAKTTACNICRSTLVVIPALNEGATLPGVLCDLKLWPLAGIRVIDNGSTDETVEIATRKGVEVLIEPIQGYGSACWKGIQDLPETVEWVLFCDADGSDDLRALDQFFEAAAQGNDLVLGNRNALAKNRHSLTWSQRFGNALAGHLINIRWGIRYHDLGPLRLIRCSSLERLVMEDRGFGWTVEMQAKAAAGSSEPQKFPSVTFLEKAENPRFPVRCAAPSRRVS